MRLLQKRGHSVTAILTQAAREFVAPLALETLTRRSVLGDLWSQEAVGSQPGEWTQHIALAHRADALLIAPATAHTIAKLAHGFCDDLLSAIFLATRKPVLLAPAMEEGMYAHPATQANLQALRKLPHVTIIPPGKGFLASGQPGRGRLAAAERILLAVERALSPPLLKGRRVLITAGATREPWDAVRFLSNSSTGRMALALAEAAYALGAAEIHLLAAHTEVRFPKGIFRITPTPTAADMLRAFQTLYAHYDWLIFAAAVSDYTFVEKYPSKHKKTDKSLQLSLVPAPDILAWAGAHRLPHQTLIGFALEEPDGLSEAQRKLQRKNADWLAFNPITPHTGMQASTNSLTLLSRWGHHHTLPLASKTDIARAMLIFIANAMAQPSAP